MGKYEVADGDGMKLRPESRHIESGSRVRPVDVVLEVGDVMRGVLRVCCVFMVVFRARWRCRYGFSMYGLL